MQWGSTIYLYPVEDSLVERFKTPPKPAQLIEAQMYGGRWEQDGPTSWKLVWTEQALKDFYLNNILIHELGHLLDSRNSRSVDRERYAEWFALQYGYKPTRRVLERSAGSDPASPQTPPAALANMVRLCQSESRRSSIGATVSAENFAYNKAATVRLYLLN